jgi:hypothetical protein
VSGQRHASAALYTPPPRKGPPISIGQEAGWASEPVWTQRAEEKSFAPAGDGTSNVRSSGRPVVRSSGRPVVRSSGRPVFSQTLYWLSYPASICNLGYNNFKKWTLSVFIKCSGCHKMLVTVQSMSVVCAMMWCLSALFQSVSVVRTEELRGSESNQMEHIGFCMPMKLYWTVERTFNLNTDGTKNIWSACKSKTLDLRF